MMNCLVIGDTHFRDFYPGYLDAQIDSINKIIRETITTRPHITNIIFLGDIFDRRSPSPTELIKFQQFIHSLPYRLNLYLLRGNHESETKADDGVTVLTLFKESYAYQALVRPIIHTTQRGNILFIPHYENEQRIKEDLGNYNANIVFGHFGFDGVIDASECMDFQIKIEDFKTRTILGHIHHYLDVGKVLVLGTPYTTNFTEADKKNYVLLLETAKTDTGYVETLIPVEHGIRHMVVDYDQIDGLLEEINNPNYHTLLRVMIQQFDPKSTPNLKEDLSKKLAAKYIEIKYKPIFDENSPLSDFVPDEPIKTLTEDIIFEYIAQNNSELNKDDILKGLEMLKHEDN